MPRFEWKDEYSVGHPGVDADHQELFRLIRKLETADHTDGFLAEIIAELEAYAERHFAREEEMLEKAGYPDLEEHRKGHAAFVEWLRAVKRTYRRSAESTFEIGERVNRFLELWLVDHILHEDMAYRDFIERS